MKTLVNDPRRRGVPLRFVEPDYWVVDRLSSESVVIDCGLGFDADFSQNMIAQYGLTSYGFDPTRKHQPGLEEIARASGGRFHFEHAAVGPEHRMVTFHESRENVSGSVLDGHRNVQADTITSYDVQMITIAEAIERAGAERVRLVKVDIEGLEYECIEDLPDALLRSVDQWLIEYHHDSVAGFPFRRTRAHLRRFRALGFDVFTLGHVNYTFYRADAPAP